MIAKNLPNFILYSKNSPIHLSKFPNFYNNANLQALNISTILKNFPFPIKFVFPKNFQNNYKYTLKIKQGPLISNISLNIKQSNHYS